MNEYTTPEVAEKAKHMVLTYKNSFKAYYRFADIGDKFDRDEFVDRSFRAITSRDFSTEDLIGVDNIPNDVCPRSYE